jgi:hypothetical protein
MAEFKEKYIVINQDILDKLNPYVSGAFQVALDNLAMNYAEVTGEYLHNKKYYVCNQDEPYAEDIIKAILKGEDDK